MQRRDPPESSVWSSSSSSPRSRGGAASPFAPVQTSGGGKQRDDNDESLFVKGRALRIQIKSPPLLAVSDSPTLSRKQVAAHTVKMDAPPSPHLAGAFPEGLRVQRMSMPSTIFNRRIHQRSNKSKARRQHHPSQHLPFVERRSRRSVSFDERPPTSPRRRDASATRARALDALHLSPRNAHQQRGGSMSSRDRRGGSPRRADMSSSSYSQSRALDALHLSPRRPRRVVSPRSRRPGYNNRRGSPLDSINSGEDSAGSSDLARVGRNLLRQSATNRARLFNREIAVRPGLERHQSLQVQQFMRLGAPLRFIEPIGLAKPYAAWYKVQQRHPAVAASVERVLDQLLHHGTPHPHKYNTHTATYYYYYYYYY